MKKAMTMFALLFLLCMIAFNGCAEELHAFENARLRSVALGSEKAFVMDNDGVLWSWDYNTEPMQLCILPVYDLKEGYYDIYGDALRELEAAVFNLVLGEDTLYGLNPYTGQIGTIDKDGVHWMVSFDASPLIYSNGWACQFQSMIVYDGALFILADRSEQGVQVVKIELSTGALTLFDATDALRMCLQRDQLLLLCATNTDGSMMNNDIYMMTMNPSTGEMSKLSMRLPEGVSWSMGLAASEDTVYLLMEGNFYSSCDGMDFELLQNSPDYVFAMQMLTDGRMAVWYSGISVLIMAENPISERLVIRGNMISDSERNAFVAAYPDVALQIMDGVLSPAEVAEHIRTGDTETDIFIVMVDASYGALVDKGYTAPLGDNTIIVASVDKMFSAVHDVLTDNQGQPMAYPVDMWAWGWGVNEELWEKHFGNEPLPSTYRELFECMMAFLALEDDDGDLFFDVYDYQAMVQYVIETHIVAHGDDTQFDDPDLQETLALLEQVQQILCERQMESWDEIELYPYEDVGGLHALFWQDMATLSTELNGSAKRIILSIDGKPFAHGRMYVMVVNPTSKRQSLAKEFIALTARPDMDATRYALLHTDGMPTKQTNYEGKEEWIVTAEGLADWARVAESLRFGERSLLLGDRMTEQRDALCERYAAGQLPLNKLLEQLNSIADMILNEHQ